ncbi:nitrogen fixation protein NifX [Neorhizobium huautlense]|uniref:nitrogen fixation protein NifX n=1 Tax=Neorhizobium huautlense TaxID=67774 RepID=UPI000CF9F028|nr:nitrogen fixation protein NifX [Neorhizobium huautlense]
MNSVRGLSLVADEMHLQHSGALRLAIATQDMKTQNAHFESAKHFAVFDVTRDGWDFLEAVSFDEVSHKTGKHWIEGDARITPKVKALSGCHLLFCVAIGGPSAAKVVSAKIHPIKVGHSEPIKDVLSRTQKMLKTAPPPWLRKALAQAGIAEKKPFEDED